MIRERFPLYVGLRARKIETMRPITAVINELLIAIQGEQTSSDDANRTI